MMERESNTIYRLVAGFLTGKLSDDELNQLNDWLEADRAHLDDFNRMRSAWILSGHEAGKKKFHPNWQNLKRRINVSENGKNRLVSYLTHTTMRYAASLLVCTALGAALSAAVLNGRATATAILPADHTFFSIVNVPLGSKSNITLPDGSTVWLNAGSSVSYESDFGAAHRDVRLTGEAFFDVQSDSLKPFNVHTSGMIVRAFGTRFNVKNYPDDASIEATLEEGKVDVLIQEQGKTATKLVKLIPNEQLVVRKTQALTKAQPTPVNMLKDKLTPIKEVEVHSNVKTELATSWKDNKWIIADEPLSLFAIDLERRYNLNIRFASKELKNYKFTGSFENETVEQILTALSIAAPVNYKFDKNNVELSLNIEDKNKFDKMLKNKNKY
jgi:ferric-dicitrate binding protein FerR (iron transport regulator)